MTKRKKWFRIVAIVFAALLAYASYDIARRTTFPGSKPQLKDRIEKNFMSKDTSRQKTDSVQEDTPDP